MALTGVTSLPRVVKLGGAWEEWYDYKDGDAFAIGDLIRITNGGEINLCALDSTTAGALHGIVMETRATEVNTQVKVLLFAPDTEIAIQCVDSGAPATILPGQLEPLEGGTGGWGILATEANGIVMVVGYLGTAVPWVAGPGAAGTDPYDETTTTNNNSVIVRVPVSVLDGRAAAA